MERIRNQVAKIFEMFEEEVFYDAVGYDEYFGPSPAGEGAPVDPRNWDLFWVTHPNGPLEEPPPRETSTALDDPELEFPRDDATQGLIDCLLQEDSTFESKSDVTTARSILEESGDDEPAAASQQSDGIAEELRSSIAKLSSILEAELALKSEPVPPQPAAAAAEIEPVAAGTEPVDAGIEPVVTPQPPRLFATLRSLLPTLSVPTLNLKLPSLKLPNLKLPSLKLPNLKLPALAIPAPSLGLSSAETVTPKPVKQELEPQHYARTPLATYARVKSRLQDQPPLVAAFADQVSVLSPSSLVPKRTFKREIMPTAQLSSTAKNLRTSGLLQNLRDLLPTPVAALLTTSGDGPRKKSLISILGGRGTKKVVAEIELDPLDDSLIPQYQKWKKIKNKDVHNAQWSCLITACILLICAIHIEKLREIKWWKFEFWQWLALGFVALAGRLVSGWCVKLMVILIEYNFLLKKRILYFIFGLRGPVKNNLWLGFILLTWTLVVQYTPDVSGTIPTVTKLLMCAFTASTLWMIKVLLVKILANAFHRTAYFDRIQDSLFHQYVLEVLSEPRSHRYAPGRGPAGTRRAVSVFKLRVSPSQKKLTPRDAKKQGRIERQYSPTPSKSRQSRDKRLEPRTFAWAKYTETDSTSTSWASKIPSIFPFALVTSSSPPLSPKSQPVRTSPRFRPQSPKVASPSPAHLGTPSHLKGGSESGSLERKSSLKKSANDSHADRSSKLKVAFQEVVEEQKPGQVGVESSPPPAALLLEPEGDVLLVAEQVGMQGDMQPEMGPQEEKEEATLVQPKPGVREQEDTKAERVDVQEQTPPLVAPLMLPLMAPLVQPLVEPLEQQAAAGVAAAAPDAGPGAADPLPQSSPEPVEAGPVPVEEVAPVTPVPIPTPLEAEKPPPPFVEPDIEMEEDDLEDEAGHEQQTTLAQDKIQILTKDSVSAWTLMRLMKVVRTRNLHMYSKSSLVEPDWEIDSIPMATAAAKHIFKNVAEPGQQELLLKNFMKFFPPNKATQAFLTFEVTVDGTITKQGLLKWVLDVYKERKSLSLTLNDNRTVIYQINLLLDGVLIAVILAISFLIMSINNKALLVCTTILLSPAVSIFGNLLRNTFESILFLFIVHPFDVGDRVSVEGVPLMVEEMRIMSTLFLNNSSEHITYPNCILINKPIANIHRSPDQWDAVEFQILANTPLEKISILRNRIDKYVLALPQIWYPRWRLIVKDIENTNKLRLLMTIQHHINFQDAGERTQRRSDMLVHIQALMNELQVGYELPNGQALVTKLLPREFPSQSVELSSM